MASLRAQHDGSRIPRWAAWRGRCCAIVAAGVPTSTGAVRGSAGVLAVVVLRIARHAHPRARRATPDASCVCVRPREPGFQHVYARLPAPAKGSAGKYARACPRMGCAPGSIAHRACTCARGRVGWEPCTQACGCARGLPSPVRAHAPARTFWTSTRATPAREGVKAMAKVERPQLRTTVSESDLEMICAAIAAGATYSAAAMAAGVRPSALRLLKRTNPAVALRLRRAWQEQARRLLAGLGSARRVAE